MIAKVKGPARPSRTIVKRSGNQEVRTSGIKDYNLLEASPRRFTTTYRGVY